MVNVAGVVHRWRTDYRVLTQALKLYCKVVGVCN